MTAHRIDATVAQFLAGETSPRKAMVIQVGDAVHELVFAPRATDARIIAMIEALGTPLDAYATVPYGRLGTASLEHQLRRPRQ